MSEKLALPELKEKLRSASPIIIKSEQLLDNNLDRIVSGFAGLFIKDGNLKVGNPDDAIHLEMGYVIVRWDKFVTFTKLLASKELCVRILPSVGVMVENDEYYFLLEHQNSNNY